MVSNRDFLIKWNINYPLDYWWRKKYNIPFNSRKHREISYIDIFYEWLEEKLYEENIKNIGEEQARIDQYRKSGEWFVPFVSEEDKKILEEKERELTDLFDKIDISSFNEGL